MTKYREIVCVRRNSFSLYLLTYKIVTLFLSRYEQHIGPLQQTYNWFSFFSLSFFVPRCTAFFPFFFN